MLKIIGVVLYIMSNNGGGIATVKQFETLDECAIHREAMYKNQVGSTVYFVCVPIYGTVTK